MRKTNNFTWLALAITLLAGTTAFAQVTTEIEAGYRVTSVDGNEDLYRTQIDEREGFIIRSFSVFTPQSTGLTDFLRVDASDFGAGPASSIRVDAGREGTYRLRVGWRSMDAFSALPAYANPLLGQGIIPGQHTWDRERTMFDVDLELLPNAKFSPFIGYSQFHNEGPGTTTYTLGGDDYLLRQNLDEKETELRIGTAFNLGRVYGSVTQGWRNLESDEVLSLARAGNNGTAPVLGTNPDASQIIRNSSLEADTPFTSLFVTGDVYKNTKLIGSYQRFSSEADGTDDEVAAGNFVSFALGRFFTGMNEFVDSRAKNETWRGSARVESTLLSKVDVMAGYRVEHRELSGSALINTLFIDSITFGGVDKRNLEEILEADSSIERDVDVLEAALSMRNLGPFAFRVSASVSDYDFTVDPDLEEIVVPGNQGGDFSRKVNTIDANASYSKSLFSIGASLRFDDASKAVLRTDYTNRDRFRLRAAFHTPNNKIRLAFTGENTNVENTLDGGGFSADGRQWSADAEFEPADVLRVRAGYSILDSESRARIRRPETFQIETWTNDEDGEVLEGGIALLLAPVSFDLNLSRYENEGTLPFSVDRWRMRTVYDIKANYGIAAEWSRDRYEEEPSYGRFDADRYGIFIRYRR
jgi:hypothetical protein